MRTRGHPILVRLDDREYDHLQAQVARTDLNREAYIRSLIMNRIPKPAPPIDYYDMLREINAIGVNLNQIAHVANATGVIDACSYRREVDELHAVILRIQRAIELPDSFP